MTHEASEARVESVRQAHWQAAYSGKSERAVSWYQDEPQPSLDLVIQFAADPTAPIIDVGGGASTLVDFLLARGFQNVTVLDLSEAALAKTRARLGSRATNAHWLVADATEWTPPQRYAVWHDRATFHFLTDEAARTAYLARLNQALLPGGHTIIATFAHEGPEKCSGLPVQRYDPDSLSQTLGPAFKRVHDQSHMHVTLGGKPQAFQFSVFRREPSHP